MRIRLPSRRCAPRNGSWKDRWCSTVLEEAVEASTDGGTDAPITPASIRAKLATCNELTVGRYRRDDIQSEPATIPVCGLKNAVFWQADMDIDCDGKITTQCSSQTDPAF